MKAFFRGAPATLAIAALCIMAWCLAQVVPLDWALWGPDVAAGEWHRPLTAMFAHVDLGHLVVNMFLLLFLGPELERFFGTAYFTLAYLAGGLGAAAAVLLMDFAAPTVGASGALYALMALLLRMYRERGMDLRAPAFLIAANLVYTFMSPGVSLWGHVAGLATGIVLAASRRVVWPVVVGVLAVVGLWISASFPQQLSTLWITTLV